MMLGDSSFFATVACDVIWIRRIEAVRKLEPLDLREISDQINQVFQNHVQVWELKVFDKCKKFAWSPPNPPNVKAIFDANVGSDRAYLVVVCRDHIARVT